MLRIHHLSMAVAVMICALVASSASAAIVTFNSANVAGNAAARTSWLSASGIATPEHIVDFEAGFTLGQNVSGVSGLFPAGLVIRDTSVAGQATITGLGGFGGANPIGLLGVRHNELQFLELDFAANPVDYVAFGDIDHLGVAGIVTFVGGATFNFNLDAAAGGNLNPNIAEFVGFFRNDQPKIVRVQLDASGDGEWGIDNIEYGDVVPETAVPEPSTLTATLLAGAAFAFVGRRRFRKFE